MASLPVLQWLFAGVTIAVAVWIGFLLGRKRQNVRDNAPADGETGRSRILAELRRTEQDYRGLFENSHDAILILDPDDETVLDANYRACLLYDIPHKDFVGRSMAELSVDGARARELWDNMRSNGRLATFESRQLRRDGTVMDVEIKAGEASYRGRRVILSVNRDVTSRAQNEKARQHLVKTLHAVAHEWTATFDAVRVPIVMVDTACRIRRLNRAAQTLAGRPFPQLVSTRVGDLGSEPWRAIEQVARQAFAGDPGSVTVTAPEHVWEVSASLTGAPAARVAIVVAYDLTRITELEASLRRNEVAAALGSLVAGVAHEVRNPLFTISATLDAWEARYGRTEGIERYAVTLRAQVDRLNRLMHELLEYGKANRLVFAEASLREIVFAACADCSTLAANQKVSIVPELDDVPAVSVDAGRLEQVLVNVIDNAIRHSPSGTSVRITLRVEGGHIVCRVLDEGPGLGSQEPEALFAPMYTRRRGGTGLGLAIARNVVTAHGGTIGIATRGEGTGAAVTIRLPFGKITEARRSA